MKRLVPVARQILVRQLGVNLCRYGDPRLGQSDASIDAKHRHPVAGSHCLGGRGMSLCAAAARWHPHDTGSMFEQPEIGQNDAATIMQLGR